LTAVFASSALGLFSGQEDINIGGQLGVQAIGIVVTIAYTGVMTWLCLKVSDVIAGNRVTDEEEVEGLDLVLHNERGYDV